MSDKLRVGLVGTGFGTRVHVPGYADCDDMELVGICSAQIVRARAAADELGLSIATDDYRELVARDDIDVIDVCTPPSSHRDIALAAFEGGKHVLCEKPLSTNAADAKVMFDRARDSGLVHAVNHEQRYSPARRYLRQLVREGFIGQQQFVVMASHASHATDPGQEPHYYGWAALADTGGGFVMASMVHDLDMVRACFGDIGDIQSRIATLIPERPVLTFQYRDGDPIGPDSPTDGMRAVDGDDAMAMVGSLPGGAMLSVNGSWALRFPAGMHLDAYGTEGSVHFQPDGRLLGARIGDEGLRELPVPPALQIQTRPGQHRLTPQFTALANEFAATVRGKGPDIPVMATFDDGYRLQVVLDTLRGMPVPAGDGQGA